MKGFIIENEYKLEEALSKFRSWSIDIGLFSDIEIQYSSLNMGMEMLVDDIIKADAIIVQSTWMYIDQLEEYVEAFLSGKLGKKEFYIVGGYENHFTNNFDEFPSELVTLINQLCETYNVYEVYYDSYDTKSWVINKIPNKH